MNYIDTSHSAEDLYKLLSSVVSENKKQHCSSTNFGTGTNSDLFAQLQQVLVSLTNSLQSDKGLNRAAYSNAGYNDSGYNNSGHSNARHGSNGYGSGNSNRPGNCFSGCQNHTTTSNFQSNTAANRQNYNLSVSLQLSLGETARQDYNFGGTLSLNIGESYRPDYNLGSYQSINIGEIYRPNYNLGSGLSIDIGSNARPNYNLGSDLSINIGDTRRVTDFGSLLSLNFGNSGNPHFFH